MQSARWQQQLRDVIRDPQYLLERSGLNPPAALPVEATASFPVKVPLAWQERIRPGDVNDPLLRQVFPLSEEDIKQDGYSTDPLGEVARTAVPGLVRKYNGRVLLVTTSVCAIHCRYCFRRHYPYSDNNPARDNWSAAIDYIREDETVREVILSGGDPLSLADDRLQSLITQLESIPQLQWLRIHTRMPVALPARVTDDLVRALTSNRFTRTMVIHANHPQEIDADVSAALDKLHRAGLQLLNQSVLLKGINDDATVLEQLSEQLYVNHVLPYYLHMLDPVSGAAHFEVDETLALSITESLRQRLPGYLVPQLVREIEGAAYKKPVQSCL